MIHNENNYSNIRKTLVNRILDIAALSKEGHIPSSLSVLDLLYVIYQSIENNKDNKLILSKGHASLGLYAVLEHYGLLSEPLETFCKFDSKLGGHPCSIGNPSIEGSTGSLGHGFPYALGLALAKKIQNQSGKVFCIIGDGEANEGTIWETALIAAHRQVDNLYCILDHNHSTDRALDIGDVVKKFSSFGWHCVEIDGHDVDVIDQIINSSFCTEAGTKITTPIFILANTTKGKGCVMMENNPEWHHKSPSEEDLLQIRKEVHEKYKFWNDISYMNLVSHRTICQTVEEQYVLFKSIEETKHILGDICEVGVQMGGSSRIIIHCKEPSKKVYFCDTFEGLQDVSVEHGEDGLWNGIFAYNLEDFVTNIQNDKQYSVNNNAGLIEIVKGYFPESATAKMNDTLFSFVHLDVDTYKSTLLSLEYFYEKMQKGGIIITHDYENAPATPGVKQAFDEFFTNKPEKIRTHNTTQASVVKL